MGIENINRPVTDEATWYATAWRSDIDDMPWAQDTLGDIDFMYRVLGLTGRERILDLACGTGRHAIELARRGHPVVAVDISPELIERGRAVAKEQGTPVEFLCSNILDLRFAKEFEVVVNLWEGAIGYLESDERNLEIFRTIGRSLKGGGQHLAGPILNADYARMRFPIRTWEKNDKMIMISELQWMEQSSRVTDSCWRIKRLNGGHWEMSDEPHIGCYRIYSPGEISSTLESIGLCVQKQYKHPARTPGVSDFDIEFWVHSIKKN